MKKLGLKPRFTTTITNDTKNVAMKLIAIANLMSDFVGRIENKKRRPKTPFKNIKNQLTPILLLLYQQLLVTTLQNEHSILIRQLTFSPQQH